MGQVWILYCDLYCLDYDGNVMDAALLGMTNVSARMLIDRATMGPGYGYRFPAFGPPGPDSDPPAGGPGTAVARSAIAEPERCRRSRAPSEEFTPSGGKSSKNSALRSASETTHSVFTSAASPGASRRPARSG